MLRRRQLNTLSVLIKEHSLSVHVSLMKSKQNLADKLARGFSEVNKEIERIMSVHSTVSVK